MTNTNLFEAAVTENNLGGKNYLNSTAQLTAVADMIAGQILDTVMADSNQEAAVKLSQSEHSAMDTLIDSNYKLEEVDTDFLKDESEDTADKMIRSQQSKRSRSKSKAMTLDNYRTMMTGAIAENLLRMAFDKPKGSYGGGLVSGSATYTEEQLLAFESDQESLNKAIRNVQSKKSIAKSKADFDESSERWASLLEAEAQLKNTRSKVAGLINVEVQEAIDAKAKAEELLTDVDVSTLSAKDAKKLISDLSEALVSK